MNYRDFLQKIIYRIINPVIKGMLKTGITPNIVTSLGFIGNLMATACFVAAGWAFRENGLQLQPASLVGWGGLVVLLAGVFDMMDGRLARMGNLSSTFGALWDSTLDRYSELFTLFGICFYFMLSGWLWTAVISFTAMVGSVMVSYVRARAEGLGIECKVGFMQRPERVVVTALAAIVTGLTGCPCWLAGGMTLIAVLANITAFWRIAHCRKVLAGKEGR